MLHFIFISFRFGKEFLLQLYYFRRYVMPLLKEKLASADDSFSQKYVRRMGFYAYFVPVISSANFAVLMNRKLTKIERIAVTQLAAATPIFDDYFDAEVLQLDTLSTMIAHPETFEATTTIERVLVELLVSIKQKVPDFPFFMEICQKVFEAQVASKKQKSEQLSAAQIRKITYDKGGYSALLFQSVIGQRPAENELNAIYHLGGLAQLLDDIFDVYEDAQEQIQTLATTQTQVAQLTQTFESDLAYLCSAFHGLGLQPSIVRKFLHLQLFFFTITFVCLRQFQALQPTPDVPFNPKAFERKMLICDMEKISNMLLWVKYFWQYKHWANK